MRRRLVAGSKHDVNAEPPRMQLELLPPAQRRHQQQQAMLELERELIAAPVQERVQVRVRERVQERVQVQGRVQRQGPAMWWTEHRS